MTEELNKCCEFQSDCIEYKDISYLKIMPICAIYELSIACHDKVNKCKYYKLYKQLIRLEQENENLKKEVKQIGSDFIKKGDYARELEQENKTLYEEKNCLHKIIDRLLENAGYSKDIASAEDFEDVYEDMQIKRNELIELEQENNAYKQSEQEASEIIAELKSKNKELKKLNKKICEDWEKEIKYYWEALEEIREMSKNGADVFDCTGCYDIYNKINEVLQ